ncbi:MAG TPA: hypothetical protein VEJ18_00815 [Planctomycetota bacterium]|nr:hypothetical protein [Planctomycetota bacterium]
MRLFGRGKGGRDRVNPRRQRRRVEVHGPPAAVRPWFRDASGFAARRKGCVPRPGETLWSHNEPRQLRGPYSMTHFPPQDFFPMQTRTERRTHTKPRPEPGRFAPRPFGTGTPQCDDTGGASFDFGRVPVAGERPLLASATACRLHRFLLAPAPALPGADLSPPARALTAPARPGPAMGEGVIQRMKGGNKQKQEKESEEIEKGAEEEEEEKEEKEEKEEEEEEENEDDETRSSSKSTSETRSSGPGPGTHGYRRKEQKRLEEKFGTPVSGETHESEHPIGMEPVLRGSREKRGSTQRAEQIEQNAPAFQQQKQLHRKNIGTGNKSRRDASGMSSAEYRESQLTALKEGHPGVAVQENQLTYGATGLAQASGTVPGKQAHDSYEAMVLNVPSVTYTEGHKNVTVPVSSQEQAEMLLAEQTASGKGEGPGGYPSKAQEKRARKKVRREGGSKKEKPDPEEEEQEEEDQEEEEKE